jgi:hypothetical protein
MKKVPNKKSQNLKGRESSDGFEYPEINFNPVALVAMCNS